MLHEHDEETHEYGTGTYAHRWNVDWRRISWGAIFAGTFVTIALFLTLQILGVGIGASTLELTGAEASSPRAYGIGAAVWWLITGLISLFIGGWVAGRLGWLPTKLDRVLHGLTTWAFFYIVMFYLLTTTLSALVGGGLSALSQTASAAGEVATSPQVQQEAEQRGLSIENIREEIAKAVGAETGQQADLGQVASATSEYLRGPRTPENRQKAAQAIAQATGQSQAEAEQMIANLEQRTEQAAETGEEVAQVAGVTFIGIAVSMLLGALAAMLGSLVVPTPRATYPHDRDRGREVKVERETYAAH
jgi:ribosomal protein L11